MKNQTNNNVKGRKWLIFGGISFIVVVLAYDYFDSNYSESLSDATPSSALVNQTKPDTDFSASIDHNNGVVNKSARVPSKGVVPKSIENLANQIVANSPNEMEAYSFLVSAKSYRIQELQTRRAKDRAAEQKALYEAELYKSKLKFIPEELELEQTTRKAQLEQNKNTQTSDLSNEYKGNSIRTVNNGRTTTGSTENAPLKLSDFRLRAILQDGDEYVASLANGERSLPARKGYTLLGKVKVLNVLPDRVELGLGKERYTLYSY